MTRWMKAATTARTQLRRRVPTFRHGPGRSPTALGSEAATPGARGWVTRTCGPVLDCARRADHRAEHGQGLVETALALPVVLLLAVGVVAAGRLTSAQGAVSAVAREAAQAAAAASGEGEARLRGHDRALAVADGYGLRRDRLEAKIDPAPFVRGGAVRVRVRYVVRLDDLPLLGWVQVPLESTDAERINRYRSIWR